MKKWGRPHGAAAPISQTLLPTTLAGVRRERCGGPVAAVANGTGGDASRGAGSETLTEMRLDMLPVTAAQTPAGPVDEHDVELAVRA